MFQKILVPVDLSEKNRKTVAAARDLCQGAELTLLHVIETIDDVPFEELESFYRRIEEKANQELAALAEQAVDGGTTVYRQVVYGKRAREIAAYADENGFDLIVLGSHPVTPDQPRSVTVSYQVAVLASCSVLLVK
jgi:universal stress protein F